MGVKREFRKCTYLDRNFTREDTHIVSERITYPDGSIEKKLNIIENYKRPFFITKDYYKKRHEQKLEYEDIKHVERIECTESDADKVLSTKLLRTPRPKGMRRIKMSPYVYWGDMRASTIIKKIYNSRLNGFFTPYEVCMLDIEADVITSEISMITVSLGDISETYVSETWLGGLNKENFKEDVYAAYAKDAPDVVKVVDGIVTLEDGSTYTLNIHFCRHEGDVIRESMAKTHEWKPDILTAWNALYDIETIAMRAKDIWDIDPKDIFSDPSIPPHLRHFSIKKDDNEYKKMNSGKESFVPFHQRWHIFTSSSYYSILDNMSAFFFIRNGSEAQVAGGYNLDNILDNYVGFKKLKCDIDEVKDLDKANWNRVMSKKYKPEYVAYNIFDSKSMILLDNKTLDLTINLPLLSQDSEFDIFKSGPKKLIDSYTFFLMDNGKVIGTKSPLANKIDGLGTKDWIVTLDAWKKGFNNTFKSFKGIPLRGNLRPLTSDLDITSSYPFHTLMFGLGTQRTAREVLDIEGFEKKYFIIQNLGICTGRTQALTYCSNMLKLPTVFETKAFLDEYMDKKINAT